MMKQMLQPMVLAAAVLAGTACTESPVPTVPVDLQATVSEGAVLALIQQAAPSTDGTVRYTVRILAKSDQLAAYQGVLTFTPGQFDVVDVTLPKTEDGEVHLVNRSALADGAIRFAAYAPEKLGTDEAFTLVVRPKGGQVPNLVATLDVAGGNDGVAKPRSSLRASDGVRDELGRKLR